MLTHLRLLLLALVLPLLARAADGRVQASLLAESTHLVPGQSLKVALQLVHAPHWHTYWKNAGTGYPTSVKWELPEGWTAGDIQWPIPGLLHDYTGAVSGHGYTGTLLLPVTLKPGPLTPGTPVTLRAQVKWLMCDDRSCVPGEAAVELSLPVDSAPSTPGSSAAAFRSITFPQPAKDFTITASPDPRGVLLRVSGIADFGPAHFFTEDDTIAFDQAQQRTDTTNGFELLLPLTDKTAKPQRLLGVLTREKPFSGYAIDLPVTLAPVPTTPASGPTAASTAATAAAASLPATLLLAFVGGLILNLMPCVFPVLGIKILGFVNQAGSDRRKVTLHGLVFTSGVLVSFWTLAGALALFRAGGDQLGWGFQLQSPVFVFVLSILMLVFALSMSGVFEFGLGATAVGSGLQAKEGYTGSFFTGVLATVVATPCSAPFLAPALGAALALPILASFSIFTTIAIGLSTPYLLLSLFPQAIKLLPRPGAWMETFRQAMAFPLYATVGYLAWVLAGQVEEQALLHALLSLTLIAAAAWLYGRYGAAHLKPRVRAIGVYGGLALFLAGAFLGWPRARTPEAITWEPWSSERVAALRAEGRPIYIDFTARWCATCQANKHVVFGSDAVLGRFSEQRVATLKADWTNSDPLITAELARWKRSAVPFNLIYLPGRADPVLLPELLTPDLVLKALEGR